MQVDNLLVFDTNPLFALMHETIYCQVSSIILSCIYGETKFLWLNTEKRKTHTYTYEENACSWFNYLQFSCNFLIFSILLRGLHHNGLLIE